MNRRHALSLLLASAAGCASDQSLVPQSVRAIDAATIDSAPLALLPEGALVIGRLNAAALFPTALGGQVAQLMTRVLPLGPASGFSPARDVQRIYGGIYAMQGADFASVVQGTFNVAAMEQAARARAAAPSGAPVVVTDYGGYSLYTINNSGFVVLTPTTILMGNETGLRRSIDRLRFTDFADRVPPWMKEVFDDARGDFAYAADFRDQGVVGAASDRLPFVNGLRMVRGTGNFQAPGINLVGGMTYQDEITAISGAQSLQELKRLAYFLTLLSNFGLGGGNAPEIRTAAAGNYVTFATAIDSQLTSTVLTMVGKLLTPGSGGFW